MSTQTTPRSEGLLSGSARTRRTGAGGSSYDLIRWALSATAGRSAAARGVLLGIISHADKNLRCHPNRETLASYHYGVPEEQVTKRQLSHVSEAVTELTEAELIWVTKKKVQGGVSNAYTLRVGPPAGDLVQVPQEGTQSEGEGPQDGEVGPPAGDPLGPPTGDPNNQGTTINNNHVVPRKTLKLKSKNADTTTTHPPLGEAAPSAARRCVPTSVGTLEGSTLPELSRKQVMRAIQYSYLSGYVTRELAGDTNLYGFPGEKPLPLGDLADLLHRKRGDLRLLWEKLPPEKRSEVLEYKIED